MKPAQTAFPTSPSKPLLEVDQRPSFRRTAFYRSLKLRKLVLLPKSNKPPAKLSSHQPVCLLDTAKKILQRITANHIEEVSEAARGLSDCHYGFRKAWSTICALRVLVKP